MATRRRKAHGVFCLEGERQSITMKDMKGMKGEARRAGSGG